MVLVNGLVVVLGVIDECGALEIFGELLVLRKSCCCRGNIERLRCWYIENCIINQMADLVWDWRSRER